MNVTRKYVAEMMIQYCFMNQLMLYLKLDEIQKDDYDILSSTMNKNPSLEFKHIIYLILNNEIRTSNEFQEKCSANFAWCKNIEKDFEYKK